jgi:hypothetical protein
MNNNPNNDMDPAAIEDMLAMIGCGESNRTPESAVRENERRLIAAGVKPIDLRSVPIEERPKYNYLPVVVPDHIARFLSDSEFPLSQEEINMLEIEIEKYHNVIDPNYIYMTHEYRETGRRYTFLQEAENFNSGFIYQHDSP